MSVPYAELDHPLDDAVLLCRGCLANSGEMKDMAAWSLTDDFYSFTNVKVDSSEGLSQLLCTICEDMLMRCRDFRTLCSNSDVLLRNIAKKKAEEAAAGASNVSDPNEAPLPRTLISQVVSTNKLTIHITAADMESKIYLECPYSECTHKFIKKKDLSIHLVKRHKASAKAFTIELRYYCYHTDCGYHFDAQTNKWFSGRKFLNQHYNKVHKCKIYRCELCMMKFSTVALFNGHLKTCNLNFTCTLCDVTYNTNEKLMVHLMRRHPDLHKQYKDERKAMKRKAKIETDTKKARTDEKIDYLCICDSPKRSFATQTRPEENIKNDVTLSQWDSSSAKSDYKTDEISTQTGFEDLLSLKSQNSEDDSMFCTENVSLSDIQTQTFPVEFGLSRSNKETLTSQTQSSDFNIKETQTCYCLFDSPKVNYKLFDSVASSPSSINLTSTQTQTSREQSDDLLSFNTTETQTYFDDDDDDGSVATSH